MLVGTLSGAAEIEPQFGPPPRVAITREKLSRIRHSPRYEERRKRAVQRAKRYVEDPPPIPDGYGSWVFYYSCDEDGKRLKPLSRKRHKCPKCGRIYTDPKRVAAYRCIMHNRLERAALRLGWAHIWTGDPKYARGVRRILVALADEYSSYPKRIDRWGRTGVMAPLGGRRYVQSLDEATGAIKLAKAYDLTRGADVWSEEDHQHVRKDFFRATARTLLWFNQGRSNHQTWYNAGLLCIGSVLGDASMVENVITMRGGYYDQLDRSVGRDGLWFEGTMAYHRYALLAMIEIVEVAERIGIPLGEDQRFQAMFTGPLKAAYPNGRFPAINDSDPMSLRGFKGLFRWAWERWRRPVFAHAYAQGNAEEMQDLTDADIEATWPLITGSANLEDSGLVRLQPGGKKANACVFFDYGPHGGGHGHFDKLNITVYADGREWVLDPGRLSYRHGEYKTWVKHTIAHNTVTVDQQSQKATSGRLLWFETTDQYAACAATTQEAYEGTSLTRQLVLTPDLLIDVFDVEANRERTLDWAVHARSEKLDAMTFSGKATEGMPGDKQGYQHLADARFWNDSRPSTWRFVHGKRQITVWLNGTTSQTIYAARGIGYRVNQREPCLVVRRRADRARFVAVYDLSGTGDHVREVTVKEQKAPHVLVSTDRGRLVVKFGPKGVRVSGPER